MEPSEADGGAECEVFMNVGCTSVVRSTCDNTSARNGSLYDMSDESGREARPGKSLELCVVEGHESRWMSWSSLWLPPLPNQFSSQSSLLRMPRKKNRFFFLCLTVVDLEVVLCSGKWNVTAGRIRLCLSCWHGFSYGYKYLVRVRSVLRLVPGNICLLSHLWHFFDSAAQLASWCLGIGVRLSFMYVQCCLGLLWVQWGAEYHPQFGDCSRYQ